MDCVEGLVNAVAERRGRPIDLRSQAMPPGKASAYCEQTPTHDVIVYDALTSPFHQWHLICHELAHLLCDHKPDQPVADDDVIRAWLPHLDPSVVRVVLGRAMSLVGRTVYADPAEHEAEVLGTLLRQLLPQRPEEATSARVASALEHRRTGADRV
ncbi:ImmA/IrrE family metallo-endopeptidase [Wenjunlia tyrosinilytica]|uniref:ImmA/IrrE family metallo-endopeptidase n=1 Tax=Wenjunlia tyrosinilytica TaxID=1544741 RepID=UPI00166D1A66|nr:ImmA/IrrE family metallo-endopeptidase [Wenjunlia tyrosinilytica]